MRWAITAATILVALIGATGCNLVPQRYQLAAEPLMDIPLTATFMQPGAPGSAQVAVAMPVSTDPMAQANLLVQDSQLKCAAFVNSLFAETAGAGLALDVLSTGTSAVAGIVTPLSNSHALAAASTVLGATKTGITANYLNTLSLGHITQAILASYTGDMSDYINSLGTVSDPKRVNIYLERSKIQNIHKKCSLAMAESTISNTLQNQPGSGAAQGLQKVHSIGDVANDTDPKILANALATEINGVFATAGVTATTSGNVVSLARPAGLTLAVTSVPPGLVTYVLGPPDLIAIIGKPQKGNTITIAGPPASQQPSAATAPTPAPGAAPAAAPANAPAPAAAVPAGAPAPVITAPVSPPGPAAVTAPSTPGGAALR